MDTKRRYSRREQDLIADGSTASRQIQLYAFFICQAETILSMIRWCAASYDGYNFVYNCLYMILISLLRSRWVLLLARPILYSNTHRLSPVSSSVLNSHTHNMHVLLCIVWQQNRTLERYLQIKYRYNSVERLSSVYIYIYSDIINVQNTDCAGMTVFLTPSHHQSSHRRRQQRQVWQSQLFFRATHTDVHSEPATTTTSQAAERHHLPFCWI